MCSFNTENRVSKIIFFFFLLNASWDLCEVKGTKAWGGESFLVLMCLSTLLLLLWNAWSKRSYHDNKRKINKYELVLPIVWAVFCVIHPLTFSYSLRFVFVCFPIDSFYHLFRVAWALVSSKGEEKGQKTQCVSHKLSEILTCTLPWSGHLYTLLFISVILLLQ